jgi:hypothetical protein
MLTAKLIGEGYAKPNADSELPIDINYAKVNEWLVSAPGSSIAAGLAALKACLPCLGVLEPAAVHVKSVQVNHAAIAAASNRLLRPPLLPRHRRQVSPVCSAPS